MRQELWPTEDREELADETRAHFAGKPAADIVFIAEDPAGAPLGMAEVSLRATGPHLEAWYVAAHARRRGYGRALTEAAEAWARGRGYAELGSDVAIDNAVSLAAHAALGFEITERLVMLRKRLS